MFLEGPILCPVDFSDYSAAALEMAGKLAKNLGAEVIALHAERVDAPVYFTAAQTQTLKAQLHRSKLAAQRHLSAFAHEHLPEGVVSSLKVVEDDPAQAILRTFKESGAGLVVMGTHGRTGLTKIRLGSVMESVLTQISGPVITVGPQASRRKSPGIFRRILFATKYGKGARAALEMAAAVADKAGAGLSVAHIMEGSEKESDLKSERESLCEWIKPASRQHCSIKEVIKRGNPPKQIVKLAESIEADLVVLSAQPKTFFGSLVFGSTIEKVIRQAPCPVLTIPVVHNSTE